MTSPSKRAADTGRPNSGPWATFQAQCSPQASQRLRVSMYAAPSMTPFDPAISIGGTVPLGAAGWFATNFVARPLLRVYELRERVLEAGLRGADGHVAATLSVTGPSTRWTRDAIARWVPVLLETAATVSGLLGFRG